MTASELAPLLDVAARTHPFGYRIDLSWTLAPTAPPTAVRIVRRTRTHPRTANPEPPEPGRPGEGVVVTAARAPVPGEPGRFVVADAGLRGGEVYYYALFPYRPHGGGPLDADDGTEIVPSGAPALASARATARAGLAEEMYSLLPAIYRRFDEPTLAAVAAGAGLLHRFLRLPGSMLDLLHADASALLGALDVEHVDGDLLPLLAQWIGWPTDRERTVGERRNDLRRAPALYRATGLAPAIEAGVRRVIGSRSRIKEFVHNVATTNRPPRWNLWQCRPGAEPELLSLDASSTGGRATAVDAGSNRTWLVYASDLDGSSQLRIKAHPPAPGEPAGAGWTGSRRLPTAGRADRPAAARSADRVLLWWDTYDDVRETSSLAAAVLAADALLIPAPDLVPPAAEGLPRRAPLAAAVDRGLWLFWQEWRADRWQLRYDHHDGRRWSETARSPLPPTWTADIGDDAWLLADPERGALWLFVTSRLLVPDREDHSLLRPRWRISVHVKRSLDPAAMDWAAVGTVPPGAGGDDDREPSARPAGSDHLDVLWSSRRGSRWSVWRSRLARASGTFETPVELTGSLSSLRAPLAPLVEPDTVVVRSSASVPIPSRTFSGLVTVDGRYPGSTTVHAADRAASAARGTFDDLGTYIYDTGRGPLNRYARDTIGVYVPADLDEETLQALRRRVPEFLPATDRAVVLREGGPG